MRRAAFLLPLALLAAPPAEADSGWLLNGISNRQMPLDAIATAPTACFSERRLRTAYATNKGINIVRASDSTTSDIGFTPAGYPDKATETTFCNATTCKLVTIYDQCGSRNLTQATDANRYVRAAGPGTWNASQATAATQTHAAGSTITPATGLASFSVVANRSVGTGACGWARENGAGNRLTATGASANNWALVGGTSGSFSRANLTDGSWWPGYAVLNGASSVLGLINTAGNAQETTGTATGSTTAAAPDIIGMASTTCNEVEEIMWDNYGITAGERLFLGRNQRVSWGF
jgi:hypothetical protein